jgi:integrase
VPYLRQTRSGFYWEPSRRLKALGFAAEPLGADPEKALARARELNEQIAARIREEIETIPPRRDTLAWVILDYRKSRAWIKLAPSTKRGYGQYLDKIEAKFGNFRPEAITRRVVKQWQETLEGHAPAFGAAILRVLRIVLKHAKNMGHKINLEDYSKLDLHTAGGNQEPWEDYEISAYLDEARRQGRQSMALALMLAVCLGQREGDIITMPRSAYDPADGSISITQHKTGRRVAVPVLPELEREIDITPKLGTIFVISEKSEKPYKEHHFRHTHRMICRAAGIPDRRKFMDLRHTAATRLGEAGCADDMIRAVTGQLDRTVVARYVKPTGTMARAAIEKLLHHRATKTRTATENSVIHSRPRDGK